MTQIVKDIDTLYSDIIDISEEFNSLEKGDFEKTLGELVDAGFLSRLMNPDDDQVLYSARPGLNWDEYVHIDSPIKNLVLSMLVSNPKAFFVLYNTQKGKMRISASEVSNWANQTSIKTVAYIFVDNDKTLADQTVDSLIEQMEGKARVFLLSSNTKITLEQIQTYIDAYANDLDGEYKMPVIVALPNKDQKKKVLALANHVQKRVTERNSTLRNGLLFDEADKIYPLLRHEFLPIINSSAIHRVGWVTATDGSLMDEDYQECANAQMYGPLDNDPSYRAFHHPDAIIHISPQKTKHGNDAYAEQILEDNRAHFQNKIALKSGEMAHRKTIVNGPSKTEQMKHFANRRVADNCYAITINMFGIKIYRPNLETVTRSFRDKRFNRALFDIYNELNLNDKPLFIIGRRKVDRGVGFHYAPRSTDEDKTPAGLIWTDMILGRIPDKAQAVQKAGRLAGKIANSQEYPLKIHYWTDEATSNSIRTHNEMVDIANTKVGCSALQATVRAKEEVSRRATSNNDQPTEVVTDKRSNHIVIVPLDIAEVIAKYSKAQAISVLKKKKPEVIAKYSTTHQIRCWNMDTDDKRNKWGLARMTAPGAISTATNVIDDTKNEVMIYYDRAGNQLILSAWTGNL
jgi:hypothetical protein